MSGPAPLSPEHTRNGASRVGGEEDSSAPRSLAAVYGANSVLGSGVETRQNEVEATTVHFLPTPDKLTAASIPDS